MVENNEQTPEIRETAAPYLRYSHEIKKAKIIRSTYLVSESTKDEVLKPTFYIPDDEVFYEELVASLKLAEFREKQQQESQKRLYPPM